MEHLLLDIAIKGTVVLLAASTAARALRDRSAAARHLVWSIAVASLAALPVLSTALPGWRLAILPAENAGAALAAVPAAAGTPWDRIAVLGWLAGAAVVLGVTAVGRARVAWLARGSEPLDHGPWPALADRIAAEIGLARPVRVRTVERPVMPMVWGVVRPVVLLPTGASGWSGSLRRHVLLHEFAHVKRHDYLVQILSRLALAVHWFNPLAWSAAGRLRLERERACDDHVLRLGADACEYAEHLVEMARRLRPSRGTALALGMADPSRFTERVMALLDGRRHRRAPTRRSVLGGCVLAAGLVVPLAAFHPARVPVTPPGTAAVVPSPGPTPAAALGSAGRDDRAEPAGAGVAAPRSVTPARRTAAREPDSPGRAARIIEMEPIDATLERRGSARGVVEANTTRGIPRPEIARIEYRRPSGAGEASERWTTTSTKASDTCEEHDRGAPARPAQLASTTLETATP